jgi:hypothetical protein
MTALQATSNASLIKGNWIKYMRSLLGSRCHKTKSFSVERFVLLIFHHLIIVHLQIEGLDFMRAVNFHWFLFFNRLFNCLLNFFFNLTYSVPHRILNNLAFNVILHWKQVSCNELLDNTFLYCLLDLHCIDLHSLSDNLCLHLFLHFNNRCLHQPLGRPLGLLMHLYLYSVSLLLHNGLLSLLVSLHYYGLYLLPLLLPLWTRITTNKHHIHLLFVRNISLLIYLLNTIVKRTAAALHKNVLLVVRQHRMRLQLVQSLNHLIRMPLCVVVKESL